MMELREIAALAIAAVMLSVITIFAVRHLQERRKFKIRQQGRGKSGTISPAE